MECLPKICLSPCEPLRRLRPPGFASKIRRQQGVCLLALDGIRKSSPQLSQRLSSIGNFVVFELTGCASQQGFGGTRLLVAESHGLLEPLDRFRTIRGLIPRLPGPVGHPRQDVRVGDFAWNAFKLLRCLHCIAEIQQSLANPESNVIVQDRKISLSPAEKLNRHSRISLDEQYTRQQPGPLGPECGRKSFHDSLQALQFERQDLFSRENFAQPFFGQGGRLKTLLCHFARLCALL